MDPHTYICSFWKRYLQKIKTILQLIKYYINVWKRGRGLDNRRHFFSFSRLLAPTRNWPSYFTAKWQKRLLFLQPFFAFSCLIPQLFCCVFWGINLSWNCCNIAVTFRKHWFFEKNGLNFPLNIKFGFLRPFGLHFLIS